MNSLGKSTSDGKRGMKDPGEMNPPKILMNKFSNLHDKEKDSEPKDQLTTGKRQAPWWQKIHLLG